MTSRAKQWGDGQGAVSGLHSAQRVARAGPRRWPAQSRPLIFTAVGLILIVVGRVHDLFVFATGSLPLAKVLIAGGMLALVMRNDTRRRLTAFKTRQGMAFALVIAAIFLSVPFSLYISSSVAWITAMVPSLVATVLLLVAACGSPSDLRILHRAMAIVPILLGGALLAGLGTEQSSRASISGMYDPNDLALVASVSLVFALSLIRERILIWRVVGALGASLALVLVVKSGSRGGFLSTLIVLVPTLLSSRSVLPRWARLVAIPVVLLSLTQLPESFRTRIATLTALNQDYNASDKIGRVAIWKRGVGYFLRRPLTGVGFAQFGTAEGGWAQERGASTGFKWSAAHNMYVEIAAELGLLGIVGFLALYMPNLRRLSTRPRQPPSDADYELLQSMGRTLAMATLAFMVGGFFLSAAFSPVAICLAALGIAHSGLTARNVRHLREAEAQRLRSGMPRFTGSQADGMR